MSIQKINSGSVFETNIAYSRAVDDGRYVFVSGTTGFDYNTMRIDDDVVKQAEQCFINIQAALEQVGSSLDQVVRVRYIFVDRNDFEPCWPVIRHYLGATKPAATMIEAGLLDQQMKVEIEVTARSTRHS